MAQLVMSTNNHEHLSSEDIKKLSNLLWGDYFYDSQTRSFSKTRRHSSDKRTFEYFCLEPIYKIYSHVIGGDGTELPQILEGLKLSKKEQHLDALPLLKVVLSKTFPNASACIVDSIVKNVPNPLDSGNLNRNWKSSGKVDKKPEYFKEKAGPLLIHCVKLIDPQDDEENDELDLEEESSFSFGNDYSFRVLGRIYSGTLQENDSVLILEPEKGDEDSDVMQEDNISQGKLRNIRLPSRGSGEISPKIKCAFPGMLVLLQGIDSQVSKSCTIVKDRERLLPSFPRLRLFELNKTKSVVKLAIEPLIPSELPKMLQGLRAIQRSYPSSYVHVEESGEHVIFGLGELQLDSIMRDLRLKYSKNTEIKVCDPFVSLCETCQDTSSFRSMGETTNGKNKFSVIAAPLEKNLLSDIERNNIDLKAPNLPQILKNEYGYDILSSRSVWVFGPDQTNCTNAFQDDTLLENKKDELYPCKDSIIQGFRWACREGPLCNEPLRGVKFKLLDASISPLASQRGPGQIIPNIRKLAHNALLNANPTLYEPVYNIDAILKDPKAEGLIKRTLQTRRGGWETLTYIPGTPLARFHGWVPVLDSFGLETELRLKSRGTVLPMMYFHRWEIVPGDVLVDSIQLKPLEPSPSEFLARDLVVKTRRRKGLPESIEIATHVDQDLLKEFARRE